MSTDIPSSEQLRNLYYELKKKHLSYLLPLESELPDCLKYNNRDEYRTTITMILSEQMSDYELSAALGPFFRDYPNLASLRHIMNSQEAKKILRKYGFATEGSRWEHNVARFWHLIETLRNKLDNTSLREFISSLSLNGNKPGTAYGRKYSRALKAYVLGEQYLLPFDGPGFKAVRKHGLYTDKADGYIDQARDKIESKISEYPDVILIDFHELLRFEWQTEGKEPEDIDRIVIGWNAWRMLCAKDRSMFTETWIIENLVEIDYLAKELWEFYQEITNT